MSMAGRLFKSEVRSKVSFMHKANPGRTPRAYDRMPRGLKQDRKALEAIDKRMFPELYQDTVVD